MKSMFYAKVSTAAISRVALVIMLGAGTVVAQKDREEKALGPPNGVRKSVLIDIPGLPAGARKLEFVTVPGLGNVKPCLLGKYEVTQGQYEALMGKNPSTFKKGPDYPVEQMSWMDAKDFCTELKTILPPEQRAKISFRLPTDEEWSVAVGLPEEEGRTPHEKSGKITNVYPWGADWPPPKDAGNYSDDINKRLYMPVLAEGARPMRFGTGADYGTIPTSAVWSRATFHLTNAVFLNSQRDGADFRLEVVPPEIYVRRVTLTREAAPRPRPADTR